MSVGAGTISQPAAQLELVNLQPRHESVPEEQKDLRNVVWLAKWWFSLAGPNPPPKRGRKRRMMVPQYEYD